MKKLNNNDLYQLLHIIKFNGNIRRLIRTDVTYIQIVDNIKSLTLENFLYYNNETLSLTDTGNSLLETLAAQYKIKNKDKWIEKEFKSKLNNKIDIDFVYLPDQNALYF